MIGQVIVASLRHQEGLTLYRLHFASNLEEAGGPNLG